VAETHAPQTSAPRAITRTALVRGAEVWGAWDGFDGIVDKRLERLVSTSVAGIIGRGGSIVGAGRSPRYFEPSVR